MNPSPFGGIFVDCATSRNPRKYALRCRLRLWGLLCRGISMELGGDDVREPIVATPVSVDSPEHGADHAGVAGPIAKFVMNPGGSLAGDDVVERLTDDGVTPRSRGQDELRAARRAIRAIRLMAIWTPRHNTRCAQGPARLRIRRAIVPRLPCLPVLPQTQRALENLCDSLFSWSLLLLISPCPPDSSALRCASQSNKANGGSG
jgi:hypothetical protein